MKAAWKKRLHDFIIQKIWGVDIASLNRFMAVIIRFFRLFYITMSTFSEGELTLRAMSLVYTTLLSLVPLLAVSFSVLKAFGVHNQLAPFLRNFLAPFGPKAGEITRIIIEFVENIKVGVLGSVGLAVLIYNVISLIQKVEEAFNSIWKIKKSRGFLRKFSDYMSVILIGPLLTFSAIGFTGSVMRTTLIQKLVTVKPFGMAAYLGGRFLPYLFVFIGFTFLYIFIPNTHVKPGSAIVGGLFAGVLWEGAGRIFAFFVVSSTKYDAIYSGLAIIIMFMIWLYLSWIIVLIGAMISFYDQYQYPQALSIESITIPLRDRLKEKLALAVMFLISHNFYYNKPPWSLDILVKHLGLPLDPIQDTLTLLEQKGFIIEISDHSPAYLPTRGIATIKIEELLDAVRKEENTTRDLPLSPPEVDEMMGRIDKAVKDAIGEETMKDLISSIE